MRGQVAINIVVPTQGLVRNVPIHEAPPNSLVDGSNVYVDEDGLLKTRQGYSPVGTLAPAERVTGILGYRDQSGLFQEVVGTISRWQKYNGDGTFTDISGGVLLTGDADDPVRLVPFAQSGQVWIYGVNNINGLKRWNSSLGAYATVTVPFDAARDIAVLANRVVVVNTSEGGTRFSSRIRWSAINDGTNFPALAVNDMLDGNDAIVGIARTSRVSAIIYRDLSAWLLSAYPGNDASAFTTERISVVDNMTGPCSPAAVVIAEGYHFYLGQDGRVYQFDGNSINPISDPIDPVVRPMLNQATSTRVCATYLPTKRSIVFFFPSGAVADPQVAVMYSIRRQAFEPLMTFADAITACAVVEESTSLTWNNWVSVTDNWNTVPFTSWDSIPIINSLNTWIGTTTGVVHRFFNAPTDNGVVIPYSATFPPVRQDPNKMQRISDVELYIKQAVSPETLGFVIWGLLQPYDTPGTSIMAVAVQLSDQSTFSVPAEPGPLNPQNIAANFLQFSINSAGVLAQLVFAGGTIFVDLDDRGSGYGVQ